MDILRQGGPPGQVRGMMGAVGCMHLEADDLAAVEVEDQVQVIPLTFDCRGRERRVPAPDLAWTGGDMCGWRARTARRPRPPPAVHLSMRA